MQLLNTIGEEVFIFFADILVNYIALHLPPAALGFFATNIERSVGFAPVIFYHTK